MKMDEKRIAAIRSMPFPLQGEHTFSLGKKKVPASSTTWELAELAYSVYSAKYGKQQTLERIAERSGFSIAEFALLLLEACGFEVKGTTAKIP